VRRGSECSEEDGNWYLFLRYRGERAAQKYESEGEAQAVAQAVRHAMTLGQFDIAVMKQRREPAKTEPTTPTLAEYYENTFKPIYIDSAVATSTAANYVKNFKKHITPALGHFRLDEVTHNEMEEFVANLVKKNFAKQTIQTILKNLCALFNHARKRRSSWTTRPADWVSSTARRMRNSRRSSRSQKKQCPFFLVAAKHHAPQHYALFFTAVHTGLRQGELAGCSVGTLISPESILSSGGASTGSTGRLFQLRRNDSARGSIRRADRCPKGASH
jgi:hypothetical protein